MKIKIYATFELIGYSGGGAVALLIGVKRDDIDKIITVAGNIDTEFWTQYHNIDPLSNSLNPADFVETLQAIKQCHLLGNEDFEASHAFGWEEAYTKFLKRFPEYM